MDQQIRFTTAPDGVRIAYAVAGEGPPLVRAAHYISHLEYDWNIPFTSHFLRAFAKNHTLIRYDERGTGLSDWDAEDLSFESWVSDLECVVDTLDLERFILFGMSQGGPVAQVYAARHPERVSHLILMGTYARGWLNRDLSDEQIEEESTIISLMKIGWGRDNPAFRQFFTAQIVPDATEEQLKGFTDMMRLSATPETAAKLESVMHRLDVRAEASQISVPTLIMHAREDAGVPFEEGRLLASLIPNAQFVPLDSRNHILTETEPAWQRYLAEVNRFLGIEDKAPAPHPISQSERRLATLLFTDIVASTETAVELGDKEWHATLEKHNAIVRQKLSEYGGTEANTTGDGFLATFETPAKAIQCAQAIAQAVTEIGIQVRCGLHSGEIEALGNDLRGIAVHIAARVVSKAGPSEVLVSSTVKDLVSGSGLIFEDRGMHTLKGIPDEWRLYALGA